MTMTIFDFFIVGLIVTFLLGVLPEFIANPKIRVSCLIGLHKYVYSGCKSGMTFDEGSRGISGTMREIYVCSCGAQKPASSEDYV